MEIACRGEDDIFPVAAERGIAGIIPAVGEDIRLLRLKVVEPYPGHPFLGAGEGDPFAVGRPVIAVPGRLIRLVHQDDLFRIYVDIPQCLLLVVEKDLPAVGRPGQGEDVCFQSRRELHGPAGAVLVTYVYLKLSRLVGDVSDVFSVGRPGSIAVVGVARLRQVEGDPLFFRDGEEIAPGAEEESFAIGREIDGRDPLRSILPAAAAPFLIVGDLYMELVHLTAADIVCIEISTPFPDDMLVVKAGELNIVIAVVGQFLLLLRGEVIDKQVHRTVPVGEEIDTVAYPHGDDVLGDIVGDLLHLFCVEVDDPDIIGHAAFVVLPRPELPEDPVEGHLLPVGREGTEPSFGEGDLFGESAFCRHHEELTRK